MSSVSAGLRHGGLTTANTANPISIVSANVTLAVLLSIGGRG